MAESAVYPQPIPRLTNLGFRPLTAGLSSRILKLSTLAVGGGFMGSVVASQCVWATSEGFLCTRIKHVWGKDGLMGTITKKDLIDRIVTRTGRKRADVKEVVQAFLDSVITELSEGNRLELRDFGVFETRERAARVAQNPRTLERVPVPARNTVKFKVGRLMKMAVENAESDLTETAQTAE